MKQPKYHLQNIYQSPRPKDVEIAKKIYLNGGLLPKTSRNLQTKCYNMVKQFNLQGKQSKFKPNMSHEYLRPSQRKNRSIDLAFMRQASLKQRSQKQKSLILKSPTKYSNSSRLNSSTSRFCKLEKTEKSTMISEMESVSNRKEKLKQSKKNHDQGKNCRVVIIQGTNQEEHYIVVDRMNDIMNQLRKQYPQYRYYKSIPSQLTIDYFLMEGQIDGKFLNGQSLYLKPCGRVGDNILDQKKQVGICSFQIIKLIGSGGFSKVFLCRFKQDGRFYAMKVIDKQIIVKNKKKKIIMNERNIMKSAQHPFMIEMKFAFESQKFLVFVMEYCPGGELFGLIKKYRRIGEDVARFYIIEIFLGLQYLHFQKIVYRDIKPQNILLNQNGHVKIADLGLAKPDMFEGQLAYSFCGSPEYMSPEMILQVGHSFPVDYYCMGALLYELLTGLPPYYSRNPDEIYEAVLSEQLTFPPEVPLTSECKSLLRGLLCKEPKLRLGSIHGVKQILAHPWFGKNKYSKFLEMEVKPPTNFASIGKVNLDDYTNEQKNKKEVEEIKRQQKMQKKKFKEVIQDFYYDFRSINQNSRAKLNKKNEIRQNAFPIQVNFRKKSPSKKKLTETTSRESKKENSQTNQKYLNFQNDQKSLYSDKLPNTTLKKITNRGSRANLFKFRPNGQFTSSSGRLKSIQNSQKL